MNNDEKKVQFHEALTFLVESANINSGVLTMDEIKKALEGLIEDESMYTLVYDYLSENKIKIKDYLPYKKSSNGENLSESNIMVKEAFSDNSDFPDNIELNQEPEISSISADVSNEDMKEQRIVEMYLEDIQNAVSLSESEELLYLKKYLNISNNNYSENNTNNSLKLDNSNETDIQNLTSRLTESNLKLVPDIAKTFKNKGVTFGDLLQEGNLGLLEGIMTYQGNADLTEFHGHLIHSIKNAMNDAILEQNTSSRIGSHVADRANELDRASINLSKELDRTPTLEELAKYLSLTEDEVERIMKMSLDALTIDNSADEE